MKKRNLFSRNLLPIMRRSNNSLLYRMCHIMNLLEDLRRLERSTISDDYEVYVSEEIQMEGDLTSFEEVIRSAHSSKWLEAMEDEMKFMSTNRVWDLEKISKGAKIVGCKWVYKTKCDSKGNIKRFKA
jgi:DNA-binding Lrp family transcriptional regulator